MVFLIIVEGEKTNNQPKQQFIFPFFFDFFDFCKAQRNVQHWRIWIPKN